MKKIALFLTLSFAIVAVGLFNFEQSKVGEPLLKNPGYEEQWLEMKTMGTGIIPENLQDQWYKASQQISLRRADGAITDIEEIGPFNVAGRIRALLIDRSDEKHIIAAGISGGIWISKDKGASWNPLNDHEITLNVSCIDQSKSNPDIIYYGTGEGSGNSVGFDGSGVFKSTDHGKTFTKLASTNNSNFNRSWKIKVDPKNADIVYLATDNRGLYRTDDGGATFAKVLSTSREMNDLEVLEDGKVFVTQKGGGIYYSSTGLNGSFSRLTSPNLPTSSFARIELAFCETQQNVMYAAFSSPDNGYNGFITAVSKSTDTGKTWTAVAAPTTSQLNAGFTWYCKTMQVHPTNPDTVFMGAVTTAYSTNGGASWSRAADPHADYHVAYNNPSSTNELYVGHDGGISLYKWDDLTKSTEYNNGINITQFYHGSYHPNELTFAGGTQDRGTRFAKNSNDVFNNILGGDGTFTHFMQEVDNVIYASSQNGNIRRLTMTGTFASSVRIRNELDADNNGTIDEGARFINPYWMNYNNGAQVFFVTNGGVWRTNNAGSNWVKITGNRPSSYSVGISNDDNPTIYIGGASVFARVDSAGTVAGGSNEINLRQKMVPLTGQFIACTRVHPTDKSIVYVGLSNYNSNSRFYVITKADTDEPEIESLGDNLPSNLPINSFDVDPSDPNNSFVVGTDFGLYSTTDRGATWEKHLEVPNVSVNTVQIRKTDGKVFMYTHGRGVFAAQLKSMKNVSVKKVTTDWGIDVYPNPSSDFLKIKGVKNTGEKVIYTILDIYGRRVKSSVVPNNQTIDVKSLPKGNYVIVIKQGMDKKSIKWIKS